MSYDDVPDSYWYVTTSSGVGIRVDEKTAHQISDECERGDKMLVFRDLTGGECRLVAAHVIGCWESTPETRKRDRDISEVVDNEGGLFS